MLNKIHNNVQNMLVEAREIMSQHLTPSKSSNSDSRTVKNPSPLSFPAEKRAPVR